jgi:hypothetical protein
MVPFDILLNHLLAAVLVWGVTLLGGFALGSALNVRLGFIGCLMFGLVYWSVALFLLPFPRGLWVALGIALFLAGRGLRHFSFMGNVRTSEVRRGGGVSAATILIFGCLAYASLFLWNFTPMGNDANMLGTAMRVIAHHRGFAQTYAPILDELPFPAVNLGLPTPGAAAVMLGAEIPSTVLALAQLSYSAWILATYLVLRLIVNRPSAAILAVVQAWDARWAQNTISWGGFSTVCSMAVGVFAVRLIWDYGREFSPRRAVAIGLTVAALPMIHGISAAVWLYALAPVLGIAVLWKSPDRKASLKQLALSGAVGGAFLLAYLAIGRVKMTPAAKAWTLDHILEDSPKPATGVKFLQNSFDYLALYGNNLFIWIGLAACAFLLVRRRWLAAAGVLASLGMLTLIMANGRWQILPGTTLLYPNRAVFWVGPVTAFAAAFAWREWYDAIPTRGTLYTGSTVGVVLLGLTAMQHYNQYQLLASNPTVRLEGWQALKWAEANLAGRGALVHGTMHNVASQLPVCAAVPTDAWHIHHMAVEDWDAIRNRTPFTHRLIVKGVDVWDMKGRIVFENGSVVIVELRIP